MSDFDVVLERLLSDPAFAAALSADPDAALAGYRLDADEVALLQLQFGTDPGGQHEVESRTNQSSLFGMFTPLVGFAGAVSVADQVNAAGPGRADPMLPEVPPVPAPSVGTPVGGLAGLGDEIGRSIQSATDAALAEPAGGLAGAVTGVAGAQTGLGSADPTEAGFGGAEPMAEAGFGAADPAAEVGFGSAGTTAEVGFGSAGLADDPAPSGAAPAVPEGYRTRVDVDGDGDWDRHTLRGRADGGVDILVDVDRDGRTDFVGHDLDADGLVEISEYDRDGDGFFEKRMYDDDGDGWMDRSVRADPPPDSSY